MDNVASFGKTMFDASAVADYAKRLAKHTGIELVRFNPMLLQNIRGGKKKITWSDEEYDLIYFALQEKLMIIINQI